MLSLVLFVLGKVVLVTSRVDFLLRNTCYSRTLWVTVALTLISVVLAPKNAAVSSPLVSVAIQLQLLTALYSRSNALCNTVVASSVKSVGCCGVDSVCRPQC